MSGLSPIEMRVLLRIVGSRPGADGSAIHTFVESHRWPGTTPDQIRDAITHLVSLGFITERGGKYFASAELQAAFINDCRNCSDTIEEFDILRQILERRKLA